MSSRRLERYSVQCVLLRWICVLPAECTLCNPAAVCTTISCAYTYEYTCVYGLCVRSSEAGIECILFSPRPHIDL